MNHDSRGGLQRRQCAGWKSCEARWVGAVTVQEEGLWLSEDDEAMKAEAPQAEEGDQEMDAAAGVADEAYIHMFLLKYVCPVEECGGTMIPPTIGDLGPADGTSIFTCTMCGLHRTEEQFMASVRELSPE